MDDTRFLVTTSAIATVGSFAFLLAYVCWVPVVALVLVLLTANRLHPNVRWLWFFMPGRWRFTVLVLAAGTELQAGARVAIIGGGWVLLGGGFVLVALALAVWVAAVFLRKAMPEAFEPIPPTREGALVAFVRAVPADVALVAGWTLLAVLMALWLTSGVYP